VSAFDVLAGPGADVDTRAWLARANPVAKLAAASVIAFALLATVDPVTAGLALLLELAVVPWSGVSWRGLARRGWIVLLAAIPAGIVTALLGADSGTTLLDAGILSISSGSLTAGVAVAVRILAIGLPGVVLMASTDPTDLADALAQNLRLPPRFVLSALAAMRLAGLLGEHWHALGMARRARGLGDEGLQGRLGTALGQVFALLVLAIRRATVLAVAMEARGFGVTQQRTWARSSRFARHDVLVIAGGVLIAAAATATGVRTGAWHLVLS
jgi:energy-coupling factor transport system permease protein